MVGLGFVVLGFLRVLGVLWLQLGIWSSMALGIRGSWFRCSGILVALGVRDSGALGLMCPGLFGSCLQASPHRLYDWSDVTKGDICEGILGAYHCEDPAVAAKHGAPEISALPTDLKDRLQPVVRVVHL